jgi:hypothetical protein
VFSPPRLHLSRGTDDWQVINHQDASGHYTLRELVEVGSRVNRVLRRGEVAAGERAVVVGAVVLAGVCGAFVHAVGGYGFLNG